ncbi:hypothetical protein [Microbulbifer aggregans]|uniref:hypothetical protein n=1 Tax=Microbulbifer aggregans TaxID=1769779 RepID=UPI001CFDC95F|nr:hypothetical protein [Microbulbifer aggregans]
MHAEAREPFWSSFSAALCALLLFSIVSTGNAAESEELSDDFWEKYADINDWVSLRLKLTPEQEDKAVPILEKNFERKIAVLKEYGFEPDKKPDLSEQQKEEIDAKFIAIRAATRAELVKILNPEQLAELKKIQQEFHEGFRKKLLDK